MVCSSAGTDSTLVLFQEVCTRSAIQCTAHIEALHCQPLGPSDDVWSLVSAAAVGWLCGASMLCTVSESVGSSFASVCLGAVAASQQACRLTCFSNISAGPVFGRLKLNERHTYLLALRGLQMFPRMDGVFGALASQLHVFKHYASCVSSGPAGGREAEHVFKLKCYGECMGHLGPCISSFLSSACSEAGFTDCPHAVVLQHRSLYHHTHVTFQQVQDRCMACCRVWTLIRK